MNVEELITKLAKERDMWKEKAMNMVEKEAYEAVLDKLKEVLQKVQEIQKKGE